MTMHARPTSADGSHDRPPLLESTSVEIERALHSSSHVGLRSVRCQFADGVVTLSGQVASFYLKQVAQAIVGRQPTVKQIRNELRVLRPEPR
ncbi:MAG: BON domain-containing protein [Pirellulaceae bacterium]|jgi:osmotically-inducible protein OsmY|nr:BON domain-containing protein [Pirellulaceae bacterium]